MIKALLLVILGIVAALELDKRMDSVRARLTPRAVTDAMLDRMNEQLEKSRTPAG
ncbi:MAG: hypothetical protein ACRDLB_07080 [Actinomycetota bacterium]